MRNTIMLIIFVCIFACSSISKFNVFISGDEQAADARIYVDGILVGVMQKKIYHRTFKADNELNSLQELEHEKYYSIGVDIGVLEGKRASKYGVYNNIRLPAKWHSIKFEKEDGRSISKKIYIKGETYLDVNFKKMEITGGYSVP